MFFYGINAKNLGGERGCEFFHQFAALLRRRINLKKTVLDAFELGGLEFGQAAPDTRPGLTAFTLCYTFQQKGQKHKLSHGSLYAGRPNELLSCGQRETKRDALRAGIFLPIRVKVGHCATPVLLLNKNPGYNFSCGRHRRHHLLPNLAKRSSPLLSAALPSLQASNLFG